MYLISQSASPGAVGTRSVLRYGSGCCLREQTLIKHTRSSDFGQCVVGRGCCARRSKVRVWLVSVNVRRCLFLGIRSEKPHFGQDPPSARPSCINPTQWFMFVVCAAQAISFLSCFGLTGNCSHLDWLRRRIRYPTLLAK